MSYQAGLLGVVSSATRGVSVATLLYRQTPQYKAKAETQQSSKAQQNANPKAQKAQEQMNKAKDERRAAVVDYEAVFNRRLNDGK